MMRSGAENGNPVGLSNGERENPRALARGRNASQSCVDIKPLLS